MQFCEAFVGLGTHMIQTLDIQDENMHGGYHTRTYQAVIKARKAIIMDQNNYSKTTTRWRGRTKTHHKACYQHRSFAN